jgi:hypothetical protein
MKHYLKEELKLPSTGWLKMVLIQSINRQRIRETQLVNKCADNVTCSEELNRRRNLLL